MSRKQIPDLLNQPSVMEMLQGAETKAVDLTQKAKTSDEINTEKVKSEVSDSENLQIPNDEEKTHKTEQVRKKNVATLSEKIKVNLYLNSSTKERTEKVQLDLRRIAGREFVGRINQSMIVETALRIVLDEFDKAREESKLSREVIKQLRN